MQAVITHSAHPAEPNPASRARNTNLLDWWRRSRSAAMIFEVVVGVAQETPAAFGLALERPAPWPRPPARVARERAVEPEVGLPSSPDPRPRPAKEKPCPPPCLWHLPRSFPHLLPQSEYNQGLKDATPVLEA